MTGKEPTAKPIVLHEINFDEVLAESSLPVLFEFWAPWCHHCTALAPVIDEVAEDLAGQVVVGQINCDLNPKLREKFKIQAIPTLFLAKKGEVVGNILNPGDKNTLMSWVKGLIE